jgi:hypothetical protein
LVCTGNFVLTRKYNNETITIEYDVQDQEVVEKNFEDYTEEQMQSMQEEDMEGEHGVRFSVTVKKDGANKSIIFDMVSRFHDTSTLPILSWIRMMFALNLR